MCLDKTKKPKKDEKKNDYKKDDDNDDEEQECEYDSQVDDSNDSDSDLDSSDEEDDGPIQRKIKLKELHPNQFVFYKWQACEHYVGTTSDITQSEVTV